MCVLGNPMSPKFTFDTEMIIGPDIERFALFFSAKKHIEIGLIGKKSHSKNEFS